MLSLSFYPLSNSLSFGKLRTPPARERELNLLALTITPIICCILKASYLVDYRPDTRHFSILAIYSIHY
jgi:hypothetical protein